MKNENNAITIYFQPAEYAQLSNFARATRRSRGAFVREILTQAGVIPEPDQTVPISAAKKPRQK